MNSDTIMFTDSEEEREVTSRRFKFIARSLSFFKNTRKANLRNNRPEIKRIHRYHYGAHERLVDAYFSENPFYDERCFRKRFRMSRTLFNWIVREVTIHDPFFSSNVDCTGKEGISALMKCTSAIRQLAYGTVPDALDEYLQMGEKTSRRSLDHFCKSVMDIFGPEYLRKPTMTDVIKLYQHHEEIHGFPGMLGSLDCTDWEWFGCPNAHKGQYVRCDHGSNPFILLEVVASQELWIWHAFFGTSGANNDINVMDNSPLFNDLKQGIAPEIPFFANGVTYPFGYYLVDGIYPELTTLVKTIPEPADDDQKRIRYKQKQESARKDVERAFGVLKKRWAVLANPTKIMKKERIMNMMYACIILHNMIRKDKKKKAISPEWYPEEAHQPDDPIRSDEEMRKVIRYIRSSQMHQNLRADLVQHLSRNI